MDVKRAERKLAVLYKRNPRFYSQIASELGFCLWFTGQLAVKPSLWLWTNVTAESEPRGETERGGRGNEKNTMKLFMVHDRRRENEVYEEK